MSSAKERAVLSESMSQQELSPDDLLAGQEAAYARDIERLQGRLQEFVAVDCPACKGAVSKPSFQKYGFQFRTCTNCETIYMSPRPSSEVMADYYNSSENYAYFAKKIFPATEVSRREKIHRPWLERVIEYCNCYSVPKGVLLEVGPGFGTFAELALKSGFFSSVVGIEPTPEMAEACRRRGVKIIEKRVEDASNEIEFANVVVSFEVIEHLFDPEFFLTQCSRLLPSGGLLVLSCPNGLGFDVAMLGPKALAVDSEHVNLFNPNSVLLLLNRCGFDVLEVTTPGRLDAELVRDAALKQEIKLDPFLQRVLLDEWDELGQPFQKFLAEHHLSSHMWLAARKR